jgi:hypothetical protein
MSNGDYTLRVNVTEPFLPLEEFPIDWFGNMYGYGSPGGIQQTPSEVEKSYEFADFTLEDPLVVDVYAGTPEPEMMALPGLTEGFEGVTPFVGPEASIGPPAEVPVDPRVLWGGGPVDSPYQTPYMSTPEPRPGGGEVNGNEYASTMPGIEFPSLRGLAEFGINTGLRYIAQRTPAPRATLIGGECPPGRVLRRTRLGRDICAKKPRMNVCNRPALSRASRRVKGFLMLAKSTEKTMRQSFAPLLRTPKRSAKGGSCGGCGARTRAACVC